MIEDLRNENELLHRDRNEVLNPQGFYNNASNWYNH